jgi:hypothetical protein
MSRCTSNARIQRLPSLLASSTEADPPAPRGRVSARTLHRQLCIDDRMSLSEPFRVSFYDCG